MPSLITGACTLTAAFGGYLLSGRREKKVREENKKIDEDRNQLTAVANFIGAERGLREKWNTDSWNLRLAIGSHPNPWAQAQEAMDLRTTYLTNVSQEVEVLHMYIHEPRVKAATAGYAQTLGKLIHANYQRYKSLKQHSVEDHRELNDLADDALGTQPLDRDLRDSRRYLVQIAIQQLRPGNEFEGMFTPFPKSPQ